MSIPLAQNILTYHQKYNQISEVEFFRKTNREFSTAFFAVKGFY